MLFLLERGLATRRLPSFLRCGVYVINVAPADTRRLHPTRRSLPLAPCPGELPRARSRWNRIVVSTKWSRTLLDATTRAAALDAKCPPGARQGRPTATGAVSTAHSGDASATPEASRFAFVSERTSSLAGRAPAASFIVAGQRVITQALQGHFGFQAHKCQIDAATKPKIETQQE